MIVRFDSFDRFETPKFTLCRPGSQYVNGALTNSLGVIPFTSDEELVANFNETSELSLRVPRISDDDDEYSIIDNIYNNTKNRSLIFVDDIGFFAVTDISESTDDDGTYKDITAKSCDIEIENHTIPSSFYDPDVTGYDIDTDMVTIKFETLLTDVLVPALPLWSVKTDANNAIDIPSSLLNKVRTFENISETTNILSFMLNDMQDAYECVFEFDTINRTITAYNQSEYSKDTSIFLSYEDLANSIQISENSDDIYTALSVSGGDDVTISAVNPLGTNVIYDFSYYLGWMSSELSAKVSAWQAKITELNAVEPTYYSKNLEYYTLLQEISNLNMQIDSTLETNIDIYTRLRSNIIVEAGLADTEDLWKTTVSGDSASVLMNTIDSYNTSAGSEGVKCTKQFQDSLTINSNSAVTSNTAVKYNSATRYISKLFIKGESGIYERELTETTATPEAGQYSYNAGTKTITFHTGEFEDGTAICAVYYQEDNLELNDVVIISDLISVVDAEITRLKAEQASASATLATKNAEKTTLANEISAMRAQVDMSTYFTSSELAELSTYIYQGSYTDEYVTYTDSMDYTQKFAQMKLLYDRAISQLSRVSSPIEEFDLDVENFIFQKDFANVSAQLETGCAISVEVRPGEIVSLFLSGITVNYADASLSMKFGSKINRYDTQTLFSDVLGNISRTANTLQFVKDTVYPIKAGELNTVKNELAKSRVISAGQAIASTNNEVTIDDAGYTGRAKLSPGQYSDEQIKIVNNMIALTKDAWQTCDIAIGKIIVDDEEVYGINAGTIIGDMLIGGQLNILATDDDGQTRNILEVVDDKIEAHVPEIHAVTTESGYTFNDSGLHIERYDSNTSNLLNNEGMEITYKNSSVLVSDSETINIPNSATVTISHFATSITSVQILNTDASVYMTLSSVDSLDQLASGKYYYKQSTRTFYLYESDCKTSENIYRDLCVSYTRDDETVLLSAKNGLVETDNLRSRQFLTIGNFARLENYSDGTDSKRTACFWVDYSANS